jgi:hypothetical protein
MVDWLRPVRQLSILVTTDELFGGATLMKQQVHNLTSNLRSNGPRDPPMGIVLTLVFRPMKRDLNCGVVMEHRVIALLLSFVQDHHPAPRCIAEPRQTRPMKGSIRGSIPDNVSTSLILIHSQLSVPCGCSGQVPDRPVASTKLSNILSCTKSTLQSRLEDSERKIASSCLPRQPIELTNSLPCHCLAL